MRGYLADTHVFLWAAEGSDRLSSSHREALAATVPTFLSIASIWEISIKAGLGKLNTPPETTHTALRYGFTLLPIAPDHAEAVRDLPPLHGDPFDRMLVAQARCEGLTLLTADPAVRRYDVLTL